MVNTRMHWQSYNNDTKKLVLTYLIWVTPTMASFLCHTEDDDENKPRPVHFTVNYTGVYPIWQLSDNLLADTTPGDVSMFQSSVSLLYHRQ